MKKAIFTFAMVAAVLAGTSCSKESLSEAEINNEANEEVQYLPDEICVSMNLPEETKASLDGLQPYWEATDSFFLTNNRGKTYYKYLSPHPDYPLDKTKAVFKRHGDAYTTEPANNMYAVYSNYFAYCSGGNYNGMSIPSVIKYQAGGYPLAFGSMITSTTSDNKWEFQTMTSLLAITVKSDECPIVKRIRVSSNNFPMSGKFTLKYVTPADIVSRFNDQSAPTPIEIDCGDGVTTTSAGTVFYVPLSTSTAKDKNYLELDGFRIEVSADGVTYSSAMIAKKNKITIKSNVIYRVNYEANAVQLYDGPFWATKNVGAATETAAGQYFNWGRLTDQSSTGYATIFESTKDFAGKWYTDNASDPTETTDRSSALYGDAVSYIMGQTWETPSKADFQQLIDSCDWVWDATYKGFWVETKNAKYGNNEIFIPAGGFMFDGELTRDGQYCHYWSSTPAPDAAWFFCNKLRDPADNGVAFSGRERGYNLRGVFNPAAY